MRWFNVQDSADRWRVFCMFLGGRGIGKTYSVFTYAFDSGLRFLYVRSTDTQIKTCLSPDKGNPFKKWAADHDRSIYIRHGDDVNDIVEIVTGEKDGEKIETEINHGYAVALSTFENLRGVDFSQIDLIIYDEFIQISPLRFDSFRSFLNMYESVNRNRELEGQEPVRVFFLANTQELNNDILAGFDLISDIESIMRSGQRRFSRGDFYIELCDSEVSAKKATTVLYRNLKSDDAYKQEAIENQFSRNDFTGIQKPKNMREYKPLCMIDSVTVWRHKSRSFFYCTKSISNKVPRFNSKNQSGLFYRNYGGVLCDAYARNTLFCDSFLTRKHILDVLHIN